MDRNDTVRRFVLAGLNPVTGDLTTSERHHPDQFEDLDRYQVKDLYFYGSGIRTSSAESRIRKLLVSMFPKAELHVADDLTAACRALSQDQPGIVCILGTGSNSCEYDGERITRRIPSLGFIVHDQGSGTHLGILLVRSYFNKSLPPQLSAELEQRYDLEISTMLHHLYELKNVNVYLAAFSRFVADHRENPFIADLIRGCFLEFLTDCVERYESARKLPVHFAGSIAHLLRQTLIEVMNERNLIPGNVIQHPIDNLIRYHKKMMKP
jgi:glucosamine kinase